MLDKQTLREIKRLAISIDHNVAFGGKSKGNKHLIRVVRVAKFLARKLGANSRIVEAGAYLHDTALPSGNDYEYSKNKRIVKRLLRQFSLSRDELNAIAECVASHEGTTTPKSLEAKIIHDADVLEKVGLLGMIRHTWKITNQNTIDPLGVNNQDIKTVTDHMLWRREQLQTLLAKKIAKYLIVPVNSTKKRMIIETAARLAVKGVVTERIALALHKHLNKQQNKKLKEQLSLSYLGRFK